MTSPSFTMSLIEAPEKYGVIVASLSTCSSDRSFLTFAR